MLSIILGIFFIVFGALLLYNSKSVSRILQDSNDKSHRKYDLRVLHQSTLKKIISYLLFKPKTYYYDLNATHNIVRFLAPLFIILGITLILIGFGLD